MILISSSLRMRREELTIVLGISVSEWQKCIIANIKKEEHWHTFLPDEGNAIWQSEKVAERVFEGNTKVADA